MTQNVHQNGPLLLGELLSETYVHALANWKAMLIGAIVFGALSFGVTAGIGIGAHGFVTNQMDRMGMDSARMEDIAARMQNGDPSVQVEFDNEMGKMVDQFEGMSPEQMQSMFGYTFIMRFLTILGWTILASTIVWLLASTFAIILTLKPNADAGTFIKLTLTYALPLLGVWIWSLLRSFIWIPLFGIIPAIILGPRFALAPVLLVRDGKGVFESVALSYTASRGYWGKIVGNMLVVAILQGIISFVVSMLLGMFLFFTPGSALIVSLVLDQGLGIFTSIFAVNMAITILMHPRVKA